MPIVESHIQKTPVRLGDLLVEKKLITQDQIQRALDHQRSSGHRKLLGEVLVELGFISQEEVMAALAEAYGIPYARVHPKVVDPRAVEILPREFLEKNCVLPLFNVHGKLTVAVPEPTNVFLVEEIQRLTGLSVQLVAATAKDIQTTLQAYLPSANVFVIDDIVEDIREDDFQLAETEVTDIAKLEEGASTSPVIKLVNYLIFSAAESGASDIHIEPGDKTLRVRDRIDGRLFEKMRPPHRMGPAIVSRIKIMASLDISERRVPQDGGITVMLNKQPIDLRVSTMPGKYGEKVVIRILDNRNVQNELETLGFATQMLDRWRELAHQPNGILLVTGPTGSGKSTTLYGTLHEIIDDTLNISTVEDPVEYYLPGVNQFQVNEKAGFTFAGALRSLLRQDPDIVMVGEIRDVETAKIATQAALTGHLVLSTLHTNDAISAVTRLINVGVEPYLVAASLRGVLAQRLVRRICAHCKEPVSITGPIERALARLPGGEKIKTIYAGRGCEKCRSTGYAGRVGVYEMFAPDDDMLELISKGAGLQELRRQAASHGYVSLAEDGLAKVKAGVTTVEELLNVTALK